MKIIAIASPKAKPYYKLCIICLYWIVSMYLTILANTKPPIILKKNVALIIINCHPPSVV